MKRRVLELIASSRGGGATHVRDLALGLAGHSAARARFAIEVAMPQDGGAIDAADFVAAGVPCRPLELSLGSTGSWRDLRRSIASFDIVHAHGARAAFHARLAASTLGPRRPAVIYTLHGWAAPHHSWPRRPAALAAERSLAGTTDRVIAVCDAERSAYLAAVKIDPARVVTIHNGVAAEGFSLLGADRDATRARLGIAPEALVVLTACRLDRPRDFTTLLDAFSVLLASHPGARLLIAGDGPLRDDIARSASRWGPAPPVTLLGWRRDLPALHAASDVFVLTSAGWEGLPLAVLEAMASGLPVVATDVGGTGEAVAHEETGLLVPPRNIDRLAAALLRLAEIGAGERARLGRRGRERVATQFRVDVAVDRIAEIYGRLASERSARP